PSIVWTFSIRYDSVRNIYALFSFTLFLHQNLKESMGKSELFEKEKIKKRSDCFDRIERVIMVHQKLHEEKKCTYYHIEFVVKDERNKHAIMMKYGIIYISYYSIG
ncbi:hypothetical protein CN958_31595, partial [Bacillus cereus]